MIKAVVRDAVSPLLLLGLTDGNLRRLKNGQPIHIDMKAMGMDRPGRVGIIWGPTEADIEGELRRAGVISDKTKITFDPHLAVELAITAEHDKILVAMVGLPRSGKSTWAQSQAWPIVNPDSIRLAIHGQRFVRQAEPFVWATAKTMVSALFLAGHKIVILDATNITNKRRTEWLSEEWTTFFKVIDTPASVCAERARAAGDEEIVPIIERMAERYEPLPAPGTLIWPSEED